MHLPQNDTGNKTETRVKQKLESLGLIVRKPVPDIGIDLEVFNPTDRSKCAKIQVKGRNPQFIMTYRWFQLRVQKIELERARKAGLPADSIWQKKVGLVDFFILDAVRYDEMWVLSKEQTFELIALNEHQYGSRPDNVFVYAENMKAKQKEMNLEAKVTGIPIIEQFESCKNNFEPILDFVDIKSGHFEN